MKDQDLKLFRSANREHLHFLWEKAQNNDLNGICAADHGRAVMMGCPKFDGAEIQVLTSKKG
jgi:hypothetical protein